MLPSGYAADPDLIGSTGLSLYLQFRATLSTVIANWSRLPGRFLSMPNMTLRYNPESLFNISRFLPDTANCFTMRKSAFDVGASKAKLARWADQHNRIDDPD